MIHHWKIMVGSVLRQFSVEILLDFDFATLQEDSRRMIALSEFGYLKEGWLDVRLSNTSVLPVNMKYDASLDKVPFID